MRLGAQVVGLLERSLQEALAIDAELIHNMHFFRKREILVKKPNQSVYIYFTT